MPLTGRLMNSKQKVVKRPAAAMKRPAKQKRLGLEFGEDSHGACK